LNTRIQIRWNVLINFVSTLYILTYHINIKEQSSSIVIYVFFEMVRQIGTQLRTEKEYNDKGRNEIWSVINGRSCLDALVNELYCHKRLVVHVRCFDLFLYVKWKIKVDVSYTITHNKRDVLLIEAWIEVCKDHGKIWLFLLLRSHVWPETHELITTHTTHTP
jgi:hypothetical protein